MGSSVQSQVEGSPAMCCISLHQTDKLRVIRFPPALLPGLRSTIQASWKQGIQAERSYGCSYELQLNGNPWTGHGVDAVRSRRLAVGVMRFMLSHGWGLEIAADLTKKTHDMDSWFFRKELEGPPTEVVMCGISFNRRDTIRIIDGSPEVIEAVRSTVQHHWPGGRQSIYCGAHEFQLNGTPWWPTGTETMQTRAFVLRLIEELRSVGWTVYASVHISYGDEGEHLDSWVLKKLKV